MTEDNKSNEVQSNAGTAELKKSTNNESSVSKVKSNGNQKSVENVPKSDSIAMAGNTKTSEKWLKYGDFTLTLFDKKVLESPKEWLTDTIVNASQYLLKRQFPSVKGLQNVLLNSLQEFTTIGRKHSFVQIVNDGGSHWVVLSNAGAFDKSKTCVIYDSRAETNNYYSDDTTLAILKLMSADPITIDIAFVSQQEDAHQCGLYAIAFAEALCAGKNPSDILFTSSGSQMRRHLIDCLTRGEITRFPTGSQTILDTYII